jgi:hypothetical protein
MDTKEQPMDVNEIFEMYFKKPCQTSPGLDFTPGEYDEIKRLRETLKTIQEMIKSNPPSLLHDIQQEITKALEYKKPELKPFYFGF